MKGNPRVIRVLQEALKAELTSINQYFVHAEMCDNWGYRRLGELTKKEAIGEMKHAEKLIERIIFLESTPQMDYFKLTIGETVKKQLENDLKLELEAVERLNKGIKTCLEVGDGTSRELLEHILEDEEEHVDFLEAQLHIIDEVGVENYLPEQIKDSSSN